MTTLSMPEPGAPVPSSATERARGQRSVNLRVAWVPDTDLEHPGWIEVGRQLGAMSRVSNWWVGDWLQYGTARWGEKYVEASRITGYDVKTLRNIAYVGRRFDLSRRRDKLTWSHHAEVAVLEPEEQDRWLDRALTERLSVSDLRVELRSAQREAKAATDEDSGAREELNGPISQLVCPNCGELIELDTAEAEASVSAAV